MGGQQWHAGYVGLPVGLVARLLENDYIPGEDMCRMVVFSRSRADGVSRTFVPPCPSPSCGDRNVVVVAVQGAPWGPLTFHTQTADQVM